MAADSRRYSRNRIPKNPFSVLGTYRYVINTVSAIIIRSQPIVFSNESVVRHHDIPNRTHICSGGYQPPLFITHHVAAATSLHYLPIHHIAAATSRHISHPPRSGGYQPPHIAPHVAAATSRHYLSTHRVAAAISRHHSSSHILTSRVSWPQYPSRSAADTAPPDTPPAPPPRSTYTSRGEG